jgi:hypothetical protein
MFPVNAAQRLKAHRQQLKAAAEARFVYDDGFKKVWKPKGDGGVIPKAVSAGTIAVDFMKEHEDGNLQTDVPSLELRVGSKNYELTWNEAYNLADMLNHIVGVAYYG